MVRDRLGSGACAGALSSLPSGEILEFEAVIRMQSSSQQ